MFLHLFFKAFVIDEFWVHGIWLLYGYGFEQSLGCDYSSYSNQSNQM
jgi:hypothetical protein